MLNEPETSLGAGTELAKPDDLFAGSIQGMEDEPNPNVFNCNEESEAAGAIATARLSFLK